VGLRVLPTLGFVGPWSVDHLDGGDDWGAAQLDGGSGCVAVGSRSSLLPTHGHDGGPWLVDFTIGDGEISWRRRRIGVAMASLVADGMDL
jgi:hypothetical protein